MGVVQPVWVGFVLSIASAAAGQPLALPFQETFPHATLDAAWTVDAAKGNTIAVENGVLEIAALQNTYAHVERPLGVDLVRVACTLKPGAGVSWVNSLFLYWDPLNWCQISALEHEKRIYVVEVVAGSPVEHRLGPCSGGAWEHVAVELAADGVRYQSSADGKAWVNQRIAQRPEDWTGRPPALLIVGKGYSREGPQYPAADLDNSYASPGPRCVSLVRSVSVTRLAADRARLSEAEWKGVERADRDPLGEAELAAVSDPSFASVSRYFPAMKAPREAIGVKDGPQEIAVLPEGSLQCGGLSAWFTVGTPPVRFGAGARGCAKRLLEGHLPIVTATWEHDGLEYRQTALGWSQGMRAESPLVACVRLQVRNPGQGVRNTNVAFQTQKAKSLSSALDWPLQLAPKGDGEVFVKMPFAPAGDAKKAAAAEFQQSLDEAAAAWKGLLSKGVQIQVPERRVNDAYRAWLAYNFLNVDKVGNRYEPHDGSGFYEAIYGYSAALYCHALDLMGYHDEAAQYLDSLLSLVKPDGLFVVNFGLPDMGALLLAVSEHYRLSGDEAWLRRATPKALAMCDWIIKRRKEAVAAQAKDSPFHGLIKFRPYADHAEAQYSYLTDCYLVVGMESLAASLERLGMPHAVAGIRKEADAYRRDVLASMGRNVIQRGGMRILPMFPETHKLLKVVNYSARDYYSLVAGMLLESRFLPANHEYARLVTDLMERRGGLVLGMCEFGGGIDHAYTYGYWLNCLERDQVKPVVLGLYGSLAYGMTRDTYSAVEVTMLRTGQNQATLPHLYSNTQQLRLLRNMLVREDGGRILLGQAIPRPWLDDGKQVRVERAPTGFGPVSFTIESHVRDGRITARIEPPTRKTPDAVVLRLRHPRDEPIKSVTVNGAATSDFDRDSVSVKEPRGPTAVETRYR